MFIYYHQLKDIVEAFIYVTSNHILSFRLYVTGFSIRLMLDM